MGAKKFFSVLGIIVGSVMIICGLTNAFEFDSVYKYIKYGADFYTDEYEATTKAANNVKKLGEVIEIMGGLVVICYFGCKLGEAMAVTAQISPVKQDELPKL